MEGNHTMKVQALTLLALGQVSCIADSPSPKTETVLIGYFPLSYRQELAPELVQKLDYLDLFSLMISPNGDLDSTDLKTSDLAIKVQMAQNFGVKSIISIGGLNRSAHFAEVCASAKARQNFNQSIIRYCQNNALSGINMDWDFPADSNERKCYGNWLNELGQLAHQQKLLISADTEGWQSAFITLNPKNIDWIQVLSHLQFQGSINGIQQSGQNGNFQDALRHLNYYESIGWQRSQLVLSIPAFGAAERTEQNSEIAAIPYQQLKIINPNSDSAQGFWFNSPSTVFQKARYLKNNDYKGAMIWELGIDRRDSLSLTKILSNILKSPRPIPWH